MPKFKKHVAGDYGWSDWDTPIMRGYKMACCDCGLVHDMEFRVLKVTKDNGDGTWECKPLDTQKYRIELRAKRNTRSTGQIRRYKKTDPIC
jgi:hypothetical protein